MIGKVMIGRSFAGVVNYNLQKADAYVLYTRGLRTDSIQSIIDDFNLQRKINKELGKAVGHIVLSWSIHDRDKLTPEIMVERAQEYMKLMDIKNTQYIIVQHNDKPHPHIHIIYNRVSDNGKTISDKFQKQRNSKIAKELTTKYGYYFAENKEQVHREQLKGADSLKYELYDTISKELKHARNWQQLESRLKEKGISIIYKYKGGTDEIQGISFLKDGIQFKGSQIDRSLSYGNINKRLISNSQQETLADALRRTARETVERGLTASEYSTPSENENLQSDIAEYSEKWLIEDLAGGFGSGGDVDDDAYKRKKRNNNNDNQMSR
ncbi:MAG: relaxase/mobilization nuclease domain-containing protein [Mucilaginibacter sp.]